MKIMGPRNYIYDNLNFDKPENIIGVTFLTYHQVNLCFHLATHMATDDIFYHLL